MTKRWRTRYLVNPRLQLSVLGVAIALSMACGLAIHFFFSLYYRDLLGALNASGNPPGSPLFEFMLIQKKKVELMLLGVFGCVAALNVIVLMVLTQKIAGPVYRIHLSIQALLRGDAERPFRVRKGDFFVDTMRLLEDVRQRGLRETKDERKAG